MLELLNSILSTLITDRELELLSRLFFAVICGLIIGIERESRFKPAGISTHCFIIAGAALFTFISISADPNSPARISAQIVSGIGFLGAGIILKSNEGTIINLTTAASIWFSASIGMVIGMGWFSSAIIATIFSALVPRIPHIKKLGKDNDR